MAIVLAVLLGLCALAFVLYPIYSHTMAMRVAQMVPQGASEEAAKDSSANGGSDGAVQPSDREQAARSALQEVELDFQLGNIAQGDYNQLRERYTRRALVALKQRYEREQELDATIEEQVRLMRTQEEQGQGEQEEQGGEHGENT